MSAEYCRRKREAPAPGLCEPILIIIDKATRATYTCCGELVLLNLDSHKVSFPYVCAADEYAVNKTRYV